MKEQLFFIDGAGAQRRVSFPEARGFYSRKVITPETRIWNGRDIDKWIPLKLDVARRKALATMPPKRARKKKRRRRRPRTPNKRPKR